jgi:hypothetical protein
LLICFCYRGGFVIIVLVMVGGGGVCGCGVFGFVFAVLSGGWRLGTLWLIIIIYYFIFVVCGETCIGVVLIAHYHNLLFHLSTACWKAVV